MLKQTATLAILLAITLTAAIGIADEPPKKCGKTVERCKNICIETSCDDDGQNCHCVQSQRVCETKCIPVNTDAVGAPRD